MGDTSREKYKHEYSKNDRKKNTREKNKTTKRDWTCLLPHLSLHITTSITRIQDNLREVHRIHRTITIIDIKHIIRMKTTSEDDDDIALRNNCDRNKKLSQRKEKWEWEHETARQTRILMILQLLLLHWHQERNTEHYTGQRSKSQKRQVKGNNISLHRLKSVCVCVLYSGKEEGNERDRQQETSNK